MKVITKQFTREILASTSFVLLALVALFAFFDLINQLDDVGKHFGLSDAFVFTALSLPARIYEVMPIAVLLASVYTMSRWASNSEFTVLRVAGLSPVSLAASLLVPGLLVVLFTYGMGELVSPPATRYAQELRVTLEKGGAVSARGYTSGVWIRDATTDEEGRKGVWIRDATTDEEGRKVDRYLNVKYISAQDRNVTGAWRFFEFNENGHLMRLIRSESAEYRDGGWVLHDAVAVVYPTVDVKNNAPMTERIEVRPAEEFLVKSSIGPDILSVMTSKPENMSMRDLDRYVAHLEKNNQQTEQYEIAFWTKVFYPLATLVMLALSMPFAYMNARSGGMAIKIFLGVMIGIVFYALNNIFSYLGAVNTWSPIAVAITPTAGMLFAAAVAMYLVERR